MYNIKVVSDSAVDCTVLQEKELNLEVVRLPINLDGVEYLEAVDISLEQFIKKMREGAVVKTSQPTFAEITRAWDKALETADEVIYVPLSSKLSGSYASACMYAEEEYKGKVTVLDLKQICYPQQQVCLDIQECIKKGMSSSEIKKLFEEKSELWAILIPEDISYLKRGGRISSAAAALANLLKIYPILKVEDGAIDVYDKVRTSKKAYQLGIDACLNGVSNVDDYHWFIVEADSMELSLKIKEEIEKKYPIKVKIVPMHAIVMSHTGPGTFCFGRYRKII